MNGPAKLLRTDDIPGYQHVAGVHEWRDGDSYLVVDRVLFDRRAGAVFTYHNPPVHQLGNPALAAFLAGFAALEPLARELKFILLFGAADPVHAGGDLKESQARLADTLAKRSELEAQGASAEDISALYNWGDARIDQGFALYSAFRKWNDRLHTVAVCGGGTRFGGSAEVPLMCRKLVGDSRSAMCFSESMIGLIPGWGGVGRAVTKAGVDNARAMAMTCPIVGAEDLKALGIYNQIVPVDEALPRKPRTDNPEADKAAYLAALEENNAEAGKALLVAGLELAANPMQTTLLEPVRRKQLATPEEVEAEVARRADPSGYADLRGQTLREAKDALATRGRPLAPQSIAKLRTLLDGVDPLTFDEEAFVRAEADADCELYRDARFMEGIEATLTQRVADFREDP